MTLAKQLLDLEALDENLLLQNPSQRKRFICLLKLMGSSWFQRRWCAQEIILAKCATVHCGDKVMPWLDFADVVQLISSRWHNIYPILDASMRMGMDVSHLVGATALVEASRFVARQGPDAAISQLSMGLESLLHRLASFDRFTLGCFYCLPVPSWYAKRRSCVHLVWM